MLLPWSVTGFAGPPFPPSVSIQSDCVVYVGLERLRDVFMTSAANFRANITRRQSRRTVLSKYSSGGQ
jgi:hypothetical protein